MRKGKLIDFFDVVCEINLRSYPLWSWVEDILIFTKLYV